MNAIKINKNTFTSTLLILFLLLIGSGILTKIIPMGSFDYKEVDGRRTIIEGSFQYIDGESLPIIKWFTAPFEVLGTSDGLIIIVIIAFLFIVGGALSILNKANVLSSIINIIINKYAKNKYFVLRVIILLFMSLGAFVGIFEEVIPLIPLSLAIALGFDVMVGLGISLLAAGFGFTAAVSNPFTILVAQKLADLPLFSGAFYRIIIFLITYLVVSQLIIMYARKVEKPIENIENAEVNVNKKTLYFFTLSISLMLVVVISSPFIPMLSDYNLPIIGFLFLSIGIGSGLTSTYQQLDRYLVLYYVY